MALLGSFVAHFGLVAYLRTIERARPQPEETPWPFTSLALPVRPPTIVPPAGVPAPEPSLAAPVTPVRRPFVPPPGRPKDLSAEVARMGLMAVIGSIGADGKLADLVGQGDDAERAFAGLGGVGLPTGPAAPRSAPPPTGSGETRRIDGLRGVGPTTDVRTGDKDEARVHPTVTPELPATTAVDGDSQALMGRMRQYKGGLIACYESALKRDPSLKGRMVLRFSMSAAGVVSQAAIESDTVGDEEMRGCILGRARAFRFPPHLDGEDEYVIPLVFHSGKT